MSLRSAGRSVCTPRREPLVLDVEAQPSARPPPLPSVGPVPPSGPGPPAAALVRPVPVCPSPPARPTSHCTSASSLSSIPGSLGGTPCARASGSGDHPGGLGGAPGPGFQAASSLGASPRPASEESPDLVLELRAQNLRLKRESERLREQVVLGSGRSQVKAVAGGQFRGSMIRGSSKKGLGVDEDEVESLHCLVRHKNGRIAQMERDLALLQSEGLSQEQHLLQMRQCVLSTNEQAAVTDEQRRNLERAMEALAGELDAERKRLEGLQLHASQATVMNKELAQSVTTLKAQLSSQCQARDEAEAHAARLEDELSAAQDRAQVLDSQLDRERTDAEVLKSNVQHRLDMFSSGRRALGRWLAAALGLKVALVWLCLQMWAQDTAHRRLERLCAGVRAEAAQAVERAELRSAEGRTLRSRAADQRSELERLQGSLAEAQQGTDTEVESARGLRVELTASESLAGNLHSEVTRLRRLELQRNEADAQRRAKTKSEADRLSHSETEWESLRHHLEEVQQELSKAAERSTVEQQRTISLEGRLCEQESAEGRSRTSGERAEARLREAEARSSNLEARLQEVPTARAASLSATDAQEREKRIQREETLLRDIRKAERERDEAVAQLKKAQQQSQQSLRKVAPGAQTPDRKAATSVRDTTSDECREAEARASDLERQLGVECAQAQSLGLEAQELQAAKLVADHASGAVSELTSQLEFARSEQQSFCNSLSETRTDLSLERGEVKKLRKVRETLEAALAQAKIDTSSCEDLRAEMHRWRDACIEATERVRGSVRILVTSPKVSINVGGNESIIHKAISRDVEQIRSALSEKVLPCFQRVVAVDEDLGDGAVRQAVARVIEDLAAAVQQEVYRALPQAEGTASWDGFGSRLTGL